MYFFELLKEYQTVAAALIGAVAVGVYNFWKASHEKSVFKHELFVSYNKRYDELNGKLEKLGQSELETALESHSGEGRSLEDTWEILFEDEPTLKGDLLSAAFDYGNLCSEEYYWYKKDYVDSDVWNCWHAGMVQWYKELFFLQKIVERQRKKNATYFNSDFLDLFPKQESGGV